MRLSIKTNWGYLSVSATGRMSFATEVGPEETFELDNLDGGDVPLPVPPPDPILTPEIDPIDGIWPPPPGTIHVRPPDYPTVNPTEVRRQLRWSLWTANSNDNESYWMRVIVLQPEEGHTPGWTADTYWFDRIAAGDGAGKGYVWPAT